MWLVDPPRNPARRAANEDIAREMGQHGYTHVWIRYVSLDLLYMQLRLSTLRLLMSSNKI